MTCMGSYVITEPRDLLRPFEPAQRLAKVDRDALASLLTDMADYKTPIAAEGAAPQRVPHDQLKWLQACVDAIGVFRKRSKLLGRDGVTRHTELMAAVRQILMVVTNLARGFDKAGAECTARIRADLAAFCGALTMVVGTSVRHDRRPGAMTNVVTALSTSVAALHLETHGAQARQAQTRQTRTLGDLVKGTASPGARIGPFEQVLAQHRTDFWLYANAIPLLRGCVFFFSEMTDFVIRCLGGPAGNPVPPVTELLPWQFPAVTLE